MKFGNYDDKTRQTPESPSFENDENSLGDQSEYFLNSININTINFNQMKINNLNLYQNSSLFPVSDYQATPSRPKQKKRLRNFQRLPVEFVRKPASI